MDRESVREGESREKEREEGGSESSPRRSSQETRLLRGW